MTEVRSDIINWLLEGEVSIQYQVQWDDRMNDAIEVLLAKRTPQGLWKVQAALLGQQHLIMEKVGKVSRWNTLRALRVLKHLRLQEETTHYSK